MINCKICCIHIEKSELLKEFNFWYLREAPIEKNCKGYVYVECKRHVESYINLSQEEWKEFSQAIEYGMKWIAENYSPQKIYIVSIGEQVPHLHVHLVPRYLESQKGLDHLKSVL